MQTHVKPQPHAAALNARPTAPIRRLLNTLKATMLNRDDLVSRLKTWLQRARTRRQLLALSPELLKDIGLSRSDAIEEGRKPFWHE